MASTFWDIPGIRSKKSLEFLVKLLDLLCVYDQHGQPIYASSTFLELLKADITEIGFFDYFVSKSIQLVNLKRHWTSALRGEPVSFMSQVKQTEEEIECTLQFNPDAKLMFLVGKRSSQRAELQRLTEEYEKLTLTLFNHPSLATALISLDGKVIRCNQRFHELLDTSENETIYIERFAHPEDKLLDVNLKQQLLSGEIESYIIEKRLITNNNETVWVNASVSLIDISTRSNEGRKYFTVLLEDVTENKNIYNALVRTEGKWKAFVLNSLNLFIQTSNTGQIIYVSPAVERILGYKAEELLDLCVLELIHPADLNEFGLSLRLWAKEIKSNKLGVECRWRTQSGGWVYLYVQGQRFPLALEIDGVALSGYNITERKRLEADLRVSEEKFRSLVLNIPGAVFRCDSTYTIQFISDGIAGITGYPASDFIDDRVRSYISIVHPDDIEFIKDSIIQSILKAQPCSIEYQIFHADGTVRWISERRQGVFDRDGNLLWFDGVLFDISDRKQAEEDLRHSEAINRAMVQVLPDLVMRMDRMEYFPDAVPTPHFKTLPPFEHSPD